jgi:hypothetical protein
MRPDEDYPFDIAILGGILKNAGGSYNKLVEDLALEPEYVFKTAAGVAKMLAGFHVNLTQKASQFKEYGIELGLFDFKDEFRKRFLASLQMDENGPAVISFYDTIGQLAKRLPELSVISHNDIHTGNVVTQCVQRTLGDQTPSYENMGVIDLGDVAWDCPMGDLVDFWVHHLRLAEGCCEDYGYSLGDFIQAYDDEVERLRGEPYQMSKEAAIIKSVMWNMLEMYDPSRKDPMPTAIRHVLAVHSDMEALRTVGLSMHANRLECDVYNLLCDVPYLKPSL